MRNTEKVRVYEVRYFDESPMSGSKRVGHKIRLISEERADRVVKRLKRSGIEAFKAGYSYTMPKAA